MPGRGQPWKKGGLVDETVTEADLGPTLADKINSGGGGGATVDLACITDDFVALSVERINERYTISNGALNFPTGQLYGVIEMDSAGVGAESAGELSTQNSFHVDPEVGDSSCAFVPIPESNQQFHFYGFTQGDLSSTVDVASITVSSLYGFMHDPAINNNWQAISRDSSVNTIVDTGVAITTSRVRLEAEHDFDAGTITYFIAGIQVAQITTNIPTDQLFLDAYASNVVVTQRSMFIDYWQGMAERI